jgi:uncharacterized membrane protein (DUF4010 family)
LRAKIDGTTAGFTLGLTEDKIRSAILLAILAFVILPVLPSAPILHGGWWNRALHGSPSI